MKFTNKAELMLRSALFTGLALATISPAFAQEAEQIPDAAEEAEGASGDDEVVVTGSRLRRDAFTSPSPLTVLDVDQGRQIGVTNITELLSRSTVASGSQIDQSLNTNAGNSNATEAPPSGGTGSSNINLRNLGPERTLVLLNGRRLAATGVRGAPSQPDIGLLPFSIIERVDIVTEAGSSIYGADAVAGTVNVVLRNDFEGLELTANVETPQLDGGVQWQVGFLAGAQGDNARITFAAEYFDRQRVSAFQRPFTAGGIREIEADASGNVVDPFGDGGIRRSGFFDNTILTFDTPAGINAFTGQPHTGSAGIFFFYTPGTTNIGVPNFSNISGLTDVVPPGLRNFSLTNNGSVTNFTYDDRYNDQWERANADLVGDLERFSFLTNGEVDLNWAGTENQFYFESLFLSRRNLAIGAIEQIFPDIPGTIPVIDESIADGLLADGSNVVGVIDNPLNPFQGTAAPILTLEDINQNRDVELQQIRFVGGMRGKFPGGFLAEKEWEWDTYFTYDRGTGFQSQTILFEPHLINATLGVFQRSDGTLGCGSASLGVGGFDTQPTCVPFNIFDPAVFTGGPNGDGVFASDAERNYLTGQRTNRTVIEQYVYNAFLSGDLFTIRGGGDVSLGFGFEYRRDSITSQNDIGGTLGLNAAENPLQEGITAGTRDFKEFFGEILIPLVEGKPGIELLSIDGAVRYTDESNFGSDVTYRARAQYKPVDWVSFSGGYGTSYRAPNLRESFLAAQGGGVPGTLDPCINANITAAVGAAPNGDQQDTIVNLINNCIASGVVFTDSDLNGFPDTTVLGTAGVTTIPTTTGGNLNLNPETSRSFTATVQVDQPWTEAFDFSIAASYYDITINNTVEEPTPGLIIGNCFQDLDFPNLSSPFCSLLSRPNTGNATSNIINNIDVTFFNIGEQTAKGIDVNTRFVAELPFFGNSSPVTFTWSTASSILLEQDEEIFDPSDRDDNVGEIGTPTFRFNTGATFAWENFTLLWESRRLGRGVQDVQDVFDANPFFPLGGANVPITADVASVPAVWYHDVGLTYALENYSFSVGVNNLLDRDPPLIDAVRGPNRNNAVSSSGYDFFGRSFFLSGRVAF